MSTARTPTLRLERSLLRGGVTRLACLDEVGRGALAGPVTLGAVVLDATTPPAPRGVRDSKLLTAVARERLAPQIRAWALGYAVGHASAAEIDEVGIVGGLRLAGHRALARLATGGILADAVLLDGNHDYLTPPEQGALFGGPGQAAPEPVVVPPVTTRVKGDLTCAGVAAASIVAKTARDAIMAELHREFPVYAWAENKGYATPAHRAALAAYGPSVYHRRSWSLPGLA